MKRFICIILAASLLSSLLIAKPMITDGPLPSGPKPKDRPSVALVLAGGGAKGFAHLPVIELIEQVGIPIDMVVGTSIGSIIGGLYSAGYSTNEIMKKFSDVDWAPMFRDTARSPYENTLMEHSLEANIFSLNFGLDFSLKLGTGLSNGQNVYQLLRNLTLKYPSDTKFDDLPIPFRAVVTDMLTGNAMVLDEGDIAEAIRASMSLPSVFAPYELDGYHFMDGGIRYNLAINVAKNMGYDIIIAVDISQKVRDNPEVYSSNPIVAMLNTITISQYTATESMYKDADLVIFPDISKFGTLDFKRSEFIYEEGKKILPKYEPLLEELRKKIYPDDYDADGNRISPKNVVKERGIYRKKANLIPTRLEIEGALPADELFIRRSFARINDEELTAKNLEKFMQAVYLTGNYEYVRPRVFDDGEETVLYLMLKQKQAKSMKIVGGFDFDQTITSDSRTALTLNLEYQVRGLTGPGSLIAIRGNAVNDYGAELYYMQPFSPYFFMEAGGKINDCHFPQMTWNFNIDDVSVYSSVKTIEGDLDFGVRTDNGNLIRFGGYYFTRSMSWNDMINTMKGSTLLEFVKKAYKSTDEECAGYEWFNDDFISLRKMLLAYDEEKNEDYSNVSGGLTSRNFGGFLEYTLDKLDKPVFSHSGFAMKLNADLDFAYTRSCVNKPSLAINVDMKGAIPCGKRVSVNPSLFVGMDVLGTMKDNPLLLLGSGFSTFDRRYFPQVINESHLGASKIAGAVSVLIEPWSQLTILGGDAILIVSGTVGNVTEEWKKTIPLSEEDWSSNPLLWSASAGLGIGIKENYNVLLRFGVANKSLTEVVPFFSLDIGSIDF